MNSVKQTVNLAILKSIWQGKGTWNAIQILEDPLLKIEMIVVMKETPLSGNKIFGDILGIICSIVFSKGKLNYCTHL